MAHLTTDQSLRLVALRLGVNFGIALKLNHEKVRAAVVDFYAFLKGDVEDDGQNAPQIAVAAPYSPADASGGSGYPPDRNARQRANLAP